MNNVKKTFNVFILTLFISGVFAQGGRDLTGTTINANAYRAEGDNHTIVQLSVNIVSPDLNYADGVRFDFGDSNLVLDAYLESDMGINPAVMMQGGEVVFGDSSDGIFNGDGIFIYDMTYDFIVHLEGQVDAPLDVGFIVYDDGWAQDYCVNDNNCEQCNDYGWGVDCDGNYLTVALNAEGIVTIVEIDIYEAPNQNPHILALTDVDNDQGKQMMLSWVAGDLIELPYFTEFSLYRYSPHPSDFVSTGSGVFYGEYFSSPGTGTSPDFGELLLTREDSLIDINFDQNPIPVNDDFQVRWTGDIFAPVDGLYNFRTHSDDGVRLFIDGNIIIDQWYDFPPTSHSGSIELSQGQHTIVLEYYENGGGAMCELFWTVPGQGESLVTPSGNDVMVSDLGTWDYLNTIPWVGDEPYASVVSTLEDEIPNAFKVVAHTDDPNLFFHSDYETGRSYDNIAPQAPSGLNASVENNVVNLNWNSVDAEDFNFYSIHRAADSLFQPNFSNFVGFSSSTNYVDESAPYNVPLYYKVSATDLGGNLGLGSSSAYAYIAVNRAPQAFDVALAPAVPNETDDITVSYVYFDPDGDNEQNTTINWFKNGEATNYTGLVLPAAATSCDDEWYAIVVPSDGELSGAESNSNVVTICGANTAPLWSAEIPMIQIPEDSEGNRFEMAGFVSDAEQAISQLALSVQGNTNEEIISASFQGSQLVVSTVSENFYGISIATLTLRADDGNEYSEAFVDVSIDPVNDNPVIVSYNGPSSFDEDESFFFEIYDFSIEDNDNDIVNMSLNILPGDNYTRSFEVPGTINTAPNFNGNIEVHVEVLDGSGGADIFIVPMEVNPVNDPSFLVTSGSDIINNGPATEEQLYSLTLSWKDPDGTDDASVYDVDLGGPADNWLDVTTVYSSGDGFSRVYNAVISGIPDDANLGQNDVSFSVTDRSEGSSESFIEYYYIPIISVNDAPMIGAYTGPTEVNEDESLELSIDKFVVLDPDNSPIDLSLILGSGQNYLASSDSKTIIPNPNYNGPLTVKAFISDGEKMDSTIVNINVAPVNDEIIVSNVPDGSAVEETAFSMSVTWTDIDGNSVDNYQALLSGGASSWVSLGTITESGDVYSLILSGTPDDENLYQNDLSLKIIDQSEGDPVEKNIFFSIAITPTDDAPVVVSYNGPTEILEEESFKASINDFVVEDVDSDFPFDFTLLAESGTYYTVSDDSKTITPTLDFAGNLDVNYLISDGSTSVQFSVSLSVLNVNDAPGITRYNGAGSFAEDTEFIFAASDFSISDPDSPEPFSIAVLEGENFTLNADGDGLIPDPNFYGTLDVDVIATDQEGASSPVYGFGLSVYPVNDAPIVKNVAISPSVPAYDDTLFVSYQTEDVEGDDVSVTVAWYKNNVLEASQTGIFVDTSFTACDETWHAVVTPNDGTDSGESFTSNSVLMCGANTAPVWTWTEPVLLQEDGNLEIDVYTKMVDAEQAPSQIVYSIASQTGDDKVSASISGQMLTLEAAELNFNGDAASEITLNAFDGGYDVQVTFSVNITPVNDAPVAVNDVLTVNEGGTVVSDVTTGLLANDSDVDGDDLQIMIVDQPMYGLLTINTDQSFSYVHDGSETTADMFTYMNSDGELSSNLTEVQITINPVNDAPSVVYSATFETLEETPFDILLSDFVIEDPDTDSGSLSLIIDAGTNYTATLITSGYTITPAENFSGQLIIPVAISDGVASSAVEEVIANVIGGNDVPEINNAIADIAVDEDADPLVFSLYGSDSLAYFSDSDGDDLVFEAFTGGSDLLMPLVMDDTLHLEFYPDAYGSDVLYVIATDASGESAVDTIAVSVTSINDAPVIINATYFVIEEEDSFTVSMEDFVYYDIDSEESSLTLNLEDGNGYGIQTIETGYKVIADPNISDTLYVPSTISDGEDSSNVWNLMVVVQPSNDAPVVVTAASDIVVDEDSEDVVISLIGSDDDPYFYDADGDSLNFDIITYGSGVVSAMIEVDSLRLSFFPNFFGEDTLLITATDPSGDDVMDTLVVTVNSVDDAPEIADAPSFETLEDDSLDVFIYQFVIRDTDTQPEAITLDISAADDTAQVVNHYTISPIEFGFRIVPDENFYGDIPLVVSAYDGSSYSDPYYVSLFVAPVNDIPEIITPISDLIADEDSEPFFVNLAGSETEPYFIDIDGDSIQFNVLAANNDIFDLSVDGYDLEIAPMADMFGVDTLHISGTDGSGSFVYDTVLVYISAINDAPGTFSLLTPEDSAEVIITAESVAAGATVDVSWTTSEDIDGDSVAYGFLLFNGPYAVETPALYATDVGVTELMIPHSAAIALLEEAGFQSLTCDWLVFATDGQDTTMSSEIRTLSLDARPVLSIDESMIPEVFALHQNYPNPFNPTTMINYDIPEAQVVSIMIYDIMGREIRTLINEFQEVGYRNIRWDARDNLGRSVSAGMYIYTIQAGDFRQVKKMVLLK